MKQMYNVVKRAIHSWLIMNTTRLFLDISAKVLKISSPLVSENIVCSVLSYVSN